MRKLAAMVDVDPTGHGPALVVEGSSSVSWLCSPIEQILASADRFVVNLNANAIVRME